MAFTFRPAIYDSGGFYELPRPVTRLRVRDGWDYAEFKVPLLDGDFRVGGSRDGVDISVEGRVGTQGGVLLADEGAMFAAADELRGRLDGPASGGFEFFIYYDAGSGTYRKFKSCTTTRLETDLSEASLFTFSLAVHAEDPVIYATGPGL